MIVGIILRNFKIYKSPTFIPISNGESFCGLIGRNGVGKSSILEALDYCFNPKEFKLNKDNKGAAAEDCYVTPIFLLGKEKIANSSLKGLAETYSAAVWGLLDTEIDARFSNQHTEILNSIKRHIKLLS